MDTGPLYQILVSLVVFFPLQDYLLPMERSVFVSQIEGFFSHELIRVKSFLIVVGKSCLVELEDMLVKL